MTEKSLQKLEQEVSGFPERAKRVIVHNDETLTKANDFLLIIKGLRKEISDTFNPIIEKAHKTHKEAVAQKKKYEVPLIDAEKMVKLQIASYMAEQERIRKEIEEKARREEEERQRIEEEKLKKAQELEKAGQMEEAEKIKEEIPQPKPYLPHEVPKLTNVGIRKIWKWRVVNKNLIPREYLMVDSAKITQLVKSTSGQIKIPGLEIYSEDSVSAQV